MKTPLPKKTLTLQEITNTLGELKPLFKKTFTLQEITNTLGELKRDESYEHYNYALLQARILFQAKAQFKTK